MPTKPIKPTALFQPFHPRNRHQGHYQFDRLIQVKSELKEFVTVNRYGNESIDFADPKAVLCLNSALLQDYYGLMHWSIPDGFLCPPIPGRADYIHSAADLLQVKRGAPVHALDIGVGANCIYPIIGYFEYGWSWVGSDINLDAIASAQNNINLHSDLSKRIVLRQQKVKTNIFHGMVQPDDRFDITVCNPPFHASRKEALASNRRKVNNLRRSAVGLNPKNEKQNTNFGGQDPELWCEGGEIAFLRRMIVESRDYAKQIRWFTSLVSREESLPVLQAELKKMNAKQVQCIPMAQGQKKSRMLAWVFND
jgi:23S rRNA (adenine1618-N6)-methyltransferase